MKTKIRFHLKGARSIDRFSSSFKAFVDIYICMEHFLREDNRRLIPNISCGKIYQTPSRSTFRCKSFCCQKFQQKWHRNNLGIIWETLVYLTSNTLLHISIQILQFSRSRITRQSNAVNSQIQTVANSFRSIRLLWTHNVLCSRVSRLLFLVLLRRQVVCKGESWETSECHAENCLRRHNDY